MSEGDCWGVNVIIVMMGVCGRNGGRVNGDRKKVSEGHGNLYKYDGKVRDRCFD